LELIFLDEIDIVNVVFIAPKLNTNSP